MTQPLVPFNSPTIDGLQIVIDNQSGKVYASQSALAKLIGKPNSSVRYHAEAMVKGVQEIDKIAAEIQTPGGLQGSQLYGEDFIYSLMAKYRPDLLVQAAKAGLRLYFYELAGYRPEVQAKQAQKALAGWKEVREATKTGHNDFQNACFAKRHPAGLVHDTITRLITGHSAKSAIESLELVEGDPTIGLNYQPSEEQLALIATAKQLYIGYKKGSWKEQAYRAVFNACPD